MNTISTFSLLKQKDSIKKWYWHTPVSSSSWNSRLHLMEWRTSSTTDCNDDISPFSGNVTSSKNGTLLGTYNIEICKRISVSKIVNAEISLLLDVVSFSDWSQFAKGFFLFSCSTWLIDYIPFQVMLKWMEIDILERSFLVRYSFLVGSSLGHSHQSFHELPSV